MAADGPGLITRITEAIVALSPAAAPAVSFDPRRWPGWMWALLNGIGLICGGIGAAVITLGPVLLWYDQALTRTESDACGPKSALVLAGAASLAGSMVATGTLVGFALGMRAGGTGPARAARVRPGRLPPWRTSSPGGSSSRCTPR